MEGVMQTPAHSTALLATPIQDRQPNGLGVSSVDFSPANGKITSTTPTLPPKRLIRKRHAMLPPLHKPDHLLTKPPPFNQAAISSTINNVSSFSSASASFPSYVSTPTPSVHPQTPEPSPKRRRTNSLSPPTVLQQNSQRSNIIPMLPRLQNPLLSTSHHEKDGDPFSFKFRMPWLDWEKHMSTLSIESADARGKLRYAAGDDIDRYNKGEFGSRHGIFRL